MKHAFLNNLMANRVMAQQVHPAGIPISSVSDLIHKGRNDRSPSQVLVIPSGIGSTNITHLREIPGVTIAEGIDTHYVSNDSSFNKFVATVETVRPTLIVAGSRGTELVTRLFKDTPKKYSESVLLLGPVHLSELFDALKSKRNRLFIVHGTKDTNEPIGMVRALVTGRTQTTRLVEATTKGHNLNFDEPTTGKQTIQHILRYATDQ